MKNLKKILTTKSDIFEKWKSKYIDKKYKLYTSDNKKISK